MDWLENGFLGYRTSLMLDFVVVALIAVVPLIVYSLAQVRFAKNYRRHRGLQITLAVILLLAVSAFEIDLHLIHGGWETILHKREVTSAQESLSRTVLRVHLLFAISTPIIWAITLTLALRRFGRNPQPGAHSRRHRLLGWIATIDLVLTSVTGLIFYYTAFVAPLG